MKMVARALAVSLVATSLSGVVMVSAAEAAVPGCVVTDEWTSGIYRYFRATNGCDSSQRFRMIWAKAVHGSCLTLGVGNSRTESRGRQAHVSELRSC